MKALLRDLLAFTKHEVRVEGQIPLPSRQDREVFEDEAREQFLSLQKIGLSIPVFTV